MLKMMILLTLFKHFNFLLLKSFTFFSGIGFLFTKASCFLHNKNIWKNDETKPIVQEIIQVKQRSSKISAFNNVSVCY